MAKTKRQMLEEVTTTLDELSKTADQDLPNLAGNEPRYEVRWFHLWMEERMAENDHKSGWRGDSFRSLLNRVEDETEALAGVLDSGDAETIIRAAADVANYAMMIADVARRLPRKAQPGE